MKRFCLFVSALLSILVLKAEPYRPYPVIMVHGYNADNYNGSNFGITILSSTEEENVSNPTTPSPVPTTIDGESGNYYISRNEGERIEYNKLAYKMAELNRNVLDYWHDQSQNPDAIYWIKNDIGLYNQIPLTNNLLDGYINEHGERVYDRPINCFLETMEFDYPEIGSSDSIEKDNISRVLTKMI